MKSVSWILVLLILAAGCAEPSVVENTEDQSKNETMETVDVGDSDVADESSDESTSDEPEVKEEATPQQMLADLRKRKASVDEYVVFIKEQAGSDLGLSALSTLARKPRSRCF